MQDTSLRVQGRSESIEWVFALPQCTGISASRTVQAALCMCRGRLLCYAPTLTLILPEYVAILQMGCVVC